MDKHYDQSLKTIDIYQLHETLLPYIGDNYEKNKILHVGESHFLSDKKDARFNAKYFLDNWWSDSCTEVTDDSPWYVDTRHVVEDNFLTGKNGSYGIFINVIKTYSKIILNEEIYHISLKSKQIYRDFAFMNFFQMPSLYHGMKYWNSLVKSANELGNKELAYLLWNKSVEVSSDTLDMVVDIIEPEMIIFTSISAYDAYAEYKQNNGVDISKDKRFIKTSHPGSPISWNKPLKSLNGETGKEKLEKAFINYRTP